MSKVYKAYEQLDDLRTQYSYLLACQEANSDRTREIRQLLVDLMDAVEQSDDEGPLVVAVGMFDEMLKDAS